MDTQIIQENIEENTISNTMEAPLLNSDIEQSHISITSDNVITEDCLICLEVLGPIQSKWMCPQCHQTIHTNCKENWNRVLTESYFICPHCKYKEINETQPSQNTVSVLNIRDNDRRISHNPTPIDFVIQQFTCYNKCGGCAYVICSITCVCILFISIYIMYTTCINITSYYNYTYID